MEDSSQTYCPGPTTKPKYSHDERTRVRARIRELHTAGLDWGQIADIMNGEGFRSPNKSALTSDVVGGQARAAGLLLRDVKQPQIPGIQPPTFTVVDLAPPALPDHTKVEAQQTDESPKLDDFGVAQVVMKSAMDEMKKRAVMRLIFGSAS